MGSALKVALALLVGLVPSVCAEKKTTSTSATPSTGSYVPLNSMTISSLFRDGASSSSSSSEVAMAGAAAAADREVLEGYEPWWNSLQEERRKRKKEREEKRKAAAAAKKNQEYRPPEHSTFPSTLFTTTQAPKVSGGGREVNIPYLLKMSDKLLSSYEAEVEAGKEGARTEERIKSALAFALHEMTERGGENAGDTKTGATFARKIFGDSDDIKVGTAKLEHIAEKEKDFLLELTSRALSRRKERIGQSEAGRYYPHQQQKEMQQQQHHYLAHLRQQQQQYVPVAIKYMKPQLERIPAPPVPERDKTYPGPEATTSEPAEEFTNFKIFNRKKQPLDVSSLASTAAVVTSSRYTTEATTTTATTASPLTYVQKYADYVDEGVKRRPPRASMPTPPNYKVTFDNSRRRRPNKVKGVAFEDLPMKKKKKKGPTRTSAPKLTQKQKFSSVKQAEEEEKGPEMSSLHLGQQEKAPLAGEGDTPGGIGSQLVSPFLAASPVPASTQFHFRRIPHVPSPSSPDKNITNSFLEVSPFMETGGSASHMAGGRRDEDGAYLKVKVIESPFLLDLETDKEGKKLLLLLLLLSLLLLLLQFLLLLNCCSLLLLLFLRLLLLLLLLQFLLLLNCCS